MSFYALDYKSCDCSPYYELEEENIKGIELEIRTDDCDYYGILDDLVYDNILICEDNYDERGSRYNMFLETDGSVDYEIKLQADTNNENLKMIQELNNYGLHPGNIQNLEGTSCHIHLNRKYLNTKDIGEYDIKKASEFLSEILYEISGRSYDDYNEWARSSLQCDLHSDLLTKAHEIDNRDLRSSARYQIVNCNPVNTIELRIFSNYFNFNKQIIEMYMDMADHIINIADMMKGKNYVDKNDEIVEWTTDWFLSNSTRKEFYKNKCLESILLTSENIKNQSIIRIRNKIDAFKNFDFNDELNAKMELFRLLRELNNYNIIYDKSINLKNPDYDNIIKYLENQL